MPKKDQDQGTRGRPQAQRPMIMPPENPVYTNIDTQGVYLYRHSDAERKEIKKKTSHGAMQQT